MYKWVVGMSFSDFLKTPYVRGVEDLGAFSTDGNGKVQVDYFVEYDALGNWYSDLAAQLGHEGARLPKYNVSNMEKTDNYRSLFTDAEFEETSKLFTRETDLVSKTVPTSPGLRVYPQTIVQ